MILTTKKMVFVTDQIHSLNKLTPSLHSHYRSFITTTSQSVPIQSIGTFILTGSLLEFFP